MQKNLKPVTMLILLCVFAVLAAGPSCDEDDNKSAALMSELQEEKERRKKTESRLDESRRELKVQKEKTEATEEDFTGASAVAFACVLSFVILAFVLIRERRSRKVLARMLRFMKERFHVFL
ncbi:MAG: hypothetical protein ACLFWL_18245 [Candidatus Brocadiia bacterium]